MNHKPTKKKISAIPLPNGVAFSSKDMISICWVQDDKYFHILIPNTNQNLQILKKIPVIRGINFLLMEIIYRFIHLSLNKLKLPEPSNKYSKSIGSLLIKYFLTILIIFSDFFIVYLFSLLLIDNTINQFIFLTLVFILIIASLIFLAYLWIGKQDINKIRRYHHALHEIMGQNDIKQTFNFDCPLTKTIFILLLTTYLNSFLPVFDYAFIWNVIISLIGFLLIFGVLFEMYDFASKNLGKKILLIVYFPIIILKKVFKLPSNESEKKAIQIALEKINKN